MSMKIVLCGPKGIGKSTLGKKIAYYLNIMFIDLDGIHDGGSEDMDFISGLGEDENILISARWKTLLDEEKIDYFSKKCYLILLKADPGILWSRLSYRKALLDMPEDINYDEFCKTIEDVYSALNGKADLVYELAGYRKSGTHREIGNLILDNYQNK